MTKNVKLTDYYMTVIYPEALAKGLKFPTGKVFIHVPKGQLVTGESYKNEEYINDPDNVPIYNINDQVVDNRAIECYGCNTGEIMSMRNEVVDSLVGIVEEV